MSRALQVSRSGFYVWTTRRPSARALEDAQLGASIQYIHGQSRGTYGLPRVHAELLAGGRHIARKRVGPPDARKGPAGRESAQVDHDDQTGLGSSGGPGLDQA